MIIKETANLERLDVGAKAELHAPRVSVILPVHNGMPYLPLAVESILGQTFRDFELIIMDDASRDATPEYLAELTDPRLRVIRNEQNLGISRSLNKGLRLARGQLIARQDADDVSLPHRLEEQVEFLSIHSDVDLVGSPAVVINEAGESTGVWQVPYDDIEIKWGLLFGNTFVHTSVMFRRAPVERIGAYSEDPSCAYIEDYDLWLRIAGTSSMASLRNPLVCWRNRAGSVSDKNQHEQLKQRQSFSVANVEALLQPNQLKLKHWLSLKKLLLASPREPVNLDSSEVRCGLSLVRHVQEAFYRRYQFAQHLTQSHNRHCCWLWGKHMLALACRNSGFRDVRCRLTLMAAGMRLLASAGRGRATG